MIETSVSAAERAEINKVLADISGLVVSDDLAIERIGGLTNRNYKITLGPERYVLRIAGAGTSEYIDRAAEAHNARIAAAADGTVAHVGYDASGGWRLVVDHGDVGGAHVVTSYLHAQGYTVRQGERVTRGQVVGSVGSTGWSTGCHLHLGARVDGRVVDPAPLIGG